MESHITTASTRSYVFDYLRVFAMFGVLAVHISQQFFVPFTFLKQVMGMGQFCVQIFFVISAYLACSYFFKRGCSTSGYYKRRLLRILPTYYAAIVAAMLYIEFTTEGYETDIFHLGWLRYFFALNTILPSADYRAWNNAFAFWTLSDFLFFYALVPYLIKVFNTFRRCVYFFFICIIVATITRCICVDFNSSCFSELPTMIRQSPLCQMQHFAAGMMTFFAVREEKKSIAVLILVLTAMLPYVVCDSALTFAILTGIFILSVKEEDIAVKSRWVLFFSKYSFHIYLTHVLALAIGWRIADLLFVRDISPFSYHLTRLFVFIGGTIALCCFLEIVQRIANRVFK